MTTLRLALCMIFACSAAVCQAEAPLDASQGRSENGVRWFDAKLLTIEGQGWSDTKSPFDRLPAKAEAKVRSAVWSLSRHSAGICARFVTDAPAVHVRWTLTSSRLAMPHMAATGVSGVDLYVKHEGDWRWLAVGRPTSQTNTAQLVSGLAPKQREYVLYFPLYNGVGSVEIGVPPEASLWPAPARPAGQRKPIVFYGTSITQGGCASRPGMVHTAIVGRWLDRPVVNLGFSGNGRMELEVAELMSELDAAAYVIDCLPNIRAAEIAQRTAPLVEQLRKSRPRTPILLVEDRNYTDAYLVEEKRRRNESSQAALREAFEKLRKSGVDRLYYLPGKKLLGNDNEGTVDSSHPTDLGFYRQALAFYETLKSILELDAN